MTTVIMLVLGVFVEILLIADTINASVPADVAVTLSGNTYDVFTWAATLLFAVAVILAFVTSWPAMLFGIGSASLVVGALLTSVLPGTQAKYYAFFALWPIGLGVMKKLGLLTRKSDTPIRSVTA